MRKITITSKLLHFLQPAGTSRGVYNTRLSFYLKLTSDEQPDVVGVGECATLPDLSCDAMPPNEYERKLRTFCDEYERTGVIDYEAMRAYPSMLFGLETAVAQFNAKGSLNFFDTPFGRGEEGIPINGLVWMGTFKEMFERLEAKLKAGFRCIKIKIGAIDFDQELQLIWAEMARLCAATSLPIGLDEELIGVNERQKKIELLDTIRPQYIVLKPSLHGGMAGTEEWIQLARERNIGSWITSALESNVGLNAIAQLTASIYGTNIRHAQGLGTGQLFADNIEMPLKVIGDKLWIMQQLHN